MVRPSTLRSAAVGALAGVLAFGTLCAVKAEQNLTVAQVHHDPKSFVNNGQTYAVTGLAQSVRHKTRRIGGKDVPYVMLDLYEVDAKGKKGSHYVYVALPAADFQSVPVEGQMAVITGPMKWPYEVAAIDP